jgi:archaellum component FlaG (FlaF/FlaG flagellin family)
MKKTSHLGLALVLALALSFILVSTQEASAAPAVSTTQTFHNQTDVITDPTTCVGAGTATLTYNGVFHITTHEEEVWVTFTQTGTFTLVAATGVTYTGHFTVWGNFNLNEKNTNTTFTFNIKGTGSDGSTLSVHEVQHFSTNANGTITSSFDKVNCG